MRCENCEENEATYRVSVTDLDGTVLDTIAVCRWCLEETTFGLYTPNTGGEKPRIEVG